MPNNVINELIFRDVDAEKQAAILASATNAEGLVDFNVLVPAPLNMWWGYVGSNHEKAFKRTHLNWAREHWGTKWNAYSHKPIERSDDTLTLRFETAWGPPWPWLAAIFNLHAVSFDHNWLDEGAGWGHSDKFDAAEKLDFGDPWTEAPADDEMQKHLHKLLWGVESFPEDEGETVQ